MQLRRANQEWRSTSREDRGRRYRRPALLGHDLRRTRPRADRHRPAWDRHALRLRHAWLADDGAGGRQRKRQRDPNHDHSLRVPDQIVVAVVAELTLYRFRCRKSLFPKFLKTLENGSATESVASRSS